MLMKLISFIIFIELIIKLAFYFIYINISIFFEFLVNYKKKLHK